MNATPDFSVPFQSFGAGIAAAAIHQQDLFNDAIGPGYRSVDLTTRTLTGERDVFGGASLLGSFSHLDNTWLWGWANPGFGQDDPAIAPTLAIRAYGEQYGVPEFVTQSPAFGAFPNPAQAATVLALTAGTLLGGHGVWSTGINDGQGTVFVHVADDQLPLATFDPIATPRLLTNAVSVFPADHRRVVRGYFNRFGLVTAESPDAIQASSPDGSKVVATFDQQHRLSNVSIRPA